MSDLEVSLLAPRRPVAETSAPVPPRFPRAEAMLEALALADLCRVAAASLEALAADANRYEPATIRRKAHGIVRALVNEFGARVVFAFGVAR